MTLPSKKTKIVCTIGPASETQDVLERMIANGMNVARLNFAHGEFAYHKKLMANIRAASTAVGKRVAIMADLPGPKMRIGALSSEPIMLHRGQSFTLQTEKIIGDAERVSVSFVGLPAAVKPGDTIFLNDGFIQLKVQSVTKKQVLCRVLIGGELRSYKGVNLPGIDLGINAFTEHDHLILDFVLEQGVDAVSQSFVQGPEDIEAVRKAAAAKGQHPFIIAKIERSRALDRMDAILQAADGVMVARGDLGVEIPIEEIAVVQKRLIRQANRLGKPVITATQMLESMVHNTRPTRAEVTDVANAILDGTDCVMLSEESAMGNFPEKVVAVMAHIAQRTETYRESLSAQKERAIAPTDIAAGAEGLITWGVRSIVERAIPVAIVTPTKSGATARSLSRFHLPAWIIAMSREAATCQNLQFSYGVFPVYVDKRPESWSTYARDWLERHGLAKGFALLTRGYSVPYAGGTNHLEVLDLGYAADEVTTQPSQQ